MIDAHIVPGDLVTHCDASDQFCVPPRLGYQTLPPFTNGPHFVAVFSRGEVVGLVLATVMVGFTQHDGRGFTQQFWCFIIADLGIGWFNADELGAVV